MYAIRSYPQLREGGGEGEGEGHGKRKRKRRSRWEQAVIVVSPIDISKLSLVTMARANQKEVHIQLLSSSSHHPPPPSTSITVEVSGCLRPWDQELEQLLATDMKAGEEVAFETAAINEMSDINLTQIILDLPAWRPGVRSVEEDEEAENKVEKHGIERVKQEYTEKRLKVQKKIDRVPLHKVGVRMPVDGMRDKSVVLNGYFIER